MLTFLEFVCTRMYGPPASSRGDGEATWPTCPACGARDKFHTRPHRPPHKDTFACWACKAWGDAADAVWWALPKSRCPERLAILADLRAEYDALPRDADGVGCGARGGGSGAGVGAATSFFRPGDADGDTSAQPDARRLKVETAVDNLMDVGDGFYGPAPGWATGGLAVARWLVLAHNVARDYDLSVADLVGRCAEVVHAKLSGNPAERLCPPRWVNPAAYDRVENPRRFDWDNAEGG